jgi:hypothetical protein
MTLTAAPPAPLPTISVRRRRAVAAMARFEALRLIRHPVVVIALLLASAAWFYSTFTGGDASRYPVLQDADRTSQLWLLFMGVAVMLAANSAAVRADRHGSAEHLDVLTTPAWCRTAALLLAVVPAALLGAVLAGGQLAFLATRPAAAGRVNVWEVATGPVVVLLLGVLGVLLGRVSRSLVVAPLAIPALYASLLFAALSPSGSKWKWLMPVVQEEGNWPLPSAVMGRPAGWHVLFLIGVTVALAVAALARSGARITMTAPIALGAAGVIIVGAVLQAGTPPSVAAAQEEATEHPSAMQQCQRYGPTTYCAFPDFLVRIRDWNPIVRAVRGLVPPQLADKPLTVRQHVYAIGGISGTSEIVMDSDAWAADDRRAGTPGAISIGTQWGGNGPRFSLAQSIAYALVTGQSMKPSTFVVCAPRAVVAVWLAANATPQTHAGFREQENALDGNAFIDLAAGSISLPPQLHRILTELLARPRGEIATRIQRSWAELVAPATSPERLAALLGVTAPRKTAGDTEAGCR